MDVERPLRTATSDHAWIRALVLRRNTGPEDGRLEPDTNIVERSIRPISIGKKNSLFCGNEGGGETWAILASILNTCKLHGVDPETYLTDVLERMVSGATKNNRLHELLVWNWQAARETEKVAA